MIPGIREIAAAAALGLALSGGTAAAQKAGGVLRVYDPDSPPGLNIYERHGAVYDRHWYSYRGRDLIGIRLGRSCQSGLAVSSLGCGYRPADPGLPPPPTGPIGHGR